MSFINNQAKLCTPELFLKWNYYIFLCDFCSNGRENEDDKRRSLYIVLDTFVLLHTILI